MKRVFEFSLLFLLALMLAGCGWIYSLIPGMDPVVGTWTLSKVSLSNAAWETASAAGWSGTATIKDDGTWSESMTASGSTMTMLGNWTDSSPGIYTLIVTSTTVTNYGTYVATLSSDQKTLYSGGGTSSFQFTKD